MLAVGLLWQIGVAVVLVGERCVAQAPNYQVVASRYYQPGEDYVVYVDISRQVEGDVDVTAEFSINNTWRGEERVLSTLMKTVQPGQRSRLVLNVPESLDYNQHSLRVTLEGGIQAVNVTSLSRSYRSSDTAVIQLDKPVYKPSDTVHLRIISVDPNLLPYEGAVDVDIRDPKGNYLRHWTDLYTDVGVITLDLPLSDQPPLGSWNIQAKFQNSSGRIITKSFRVEEYVLPKWSVELELPSYLERSKKPTLKGTIRGKYTYGEDVKGTATIILRRPTYGRYSSCSCEQNENVNILRKQTITLDGKTDFSIEFVLADRYLYNMEVFAAITEGVTGEIRNVTESVQVIDDPFNVNLEVAEYFKPTLPYRFTVKVSRHNDEPLIVSKDSKEVIIGYYFQIPEPTTPGMEVSPVGFADQHRFQPRPTSDDVEFIKRSYLLPANGTISLALIPPIETESLRLQVYYGGSLRTTRNVNKYVALNNAFVNVQQVSETLKAGGNGMFRINSSVPINGFHYAVTADGNGLINMDYITTITDKSVIDFSIGITSNMAPDAKLLVYFFHQGETVADALQIAVDGAFQNEVTVAFNSSREEPGKNIRLTVQAAPNSFVGINAIDYSLKLLGDDHDIKREQFVPEQSRYFYGDYNQHAQRELSYAQLLLFTDAVIFDGRREPVNDPCVSSGSRGGYGGGASYNSISSYSSDVDADGAVQLARAPAAPTSAKAGSGGALASVERVRKFFPETWLWSNTSTNSSGIVSIDTIVPDTITSYSANAFSVSKELGLGIAAEPANVEVFRPFFITLNLPYSVVRGEDVELKVLIFNYLPENKQVAVTLERSEDFQAIFSEQEVRSDDLRKRVNVKGNDVESASFLIRPSKVGLLKIKARAQTEGAADAISKDLLVKAEGVTVHTNAAIFIDVDEGDAIWEQNNLQSFPDNIIPDSERLEVSVTGDIMGPTIKSLGNLLRIPHGCGEQNMVNFAPNIYILNYLTSTRQLTDELTSKAIRYMDTGYQREITYQRKDGSFSAFGDNDDSGSVWLTAFVIKSFSEADPHIFIEKDLLKKAMSWLLAKNREGRFEEVGRIISQSIQGGSGEGTALSSYVLIALIEAQKILTPAEHAEVDSSGDIGVSIDLELPAGVPVLPGGFFGGAVSNDEGFLIGVTITAVQENLERQIEALATNSSGSYELAIATYALHLAGSEVADLAYQYLLDRAIRNEQDLMYWRGPEDEFEISPIIVFDSWSRSSGNSLRIRPIDVEASAYALLTIALRNDVEAGFPALRWMSKQRNSMGGFISTQDTVVGLQALTEFSALVYDPNTDLQITVNSEVDENLFSHDFFVDSANSILLQSVVVDGVRGQQQLDLNFKANGQGTALVQVAASYNQLEEPVENSPFDLRVESQLVMGGGLKVGACARYLLPRSSNMAVMEVRLPSGYSVDMEQAFLLQERNVHVQRIEGVEGNTQLNLYFNSIGEEEICVNVVAQQDYEVRRRKPAYVKLYDYYEPSKQVTESYTDEPEQQTVAAIYTRSSGQGSGFTGFLTG